MSDLLSKFWHRRHNDWQWYDEVQIVTVPRYKTSSMSGDEWRISAIVRVFFKGALIVERGYSNIEYATKLLVGMLVEANDNGISDRVIMREAECCDQLTCENEPTVFVTPKRLTANDGSYLDPLETHLRYYRAFCPKHATRGDCGREDSDANYVVIEGAERDEIIASRAREVASIRSRIAESNP